MIIQKDGIKRTVDLPAQFCVKTEEAREIIRALQEFVAGTGVYGWVSINLTESHFAGANVKPLGWRDPA